MAFSQAWASPPFAPLTPVASSDPKEKGQLPRVIFASTCMLFFTNCS